MKSSSSRPTILVVEDEEPVRRLVAVFLERQGYPVLVAATETEARELWAVQQAKIGVLFTDIELGSGGNGWELARQFHRDKPDLKIICTSANPVALNISTSLSGAIRLPKPYSLDDLEQILHRLEKP